MERAEVQIMATLSHVSTYRPKLEEKPVLPLEQRALEERRVLLGDGEVRSCCTNLKHVLFVYSILQNLS